MDDLESRCKAYIEDRLPAEERKAIEARIANGDKEIIAILKRLQSFENPARHSDANPSQPDKKSAGLDKYYKSSQQKNSSTDEKEAHQPSVKNTNTSFTINTAGKFRDHLYKFTGVLIGILVLVLAYIQWENKAMEQHLALNKSTIQKLEKDNTLKQQKLRTVSRTLNRIKAIIGGKAVEYIQFEGDGKYINQGSIIWDRSTFRMAMIFPESVLPSQYSLSLWTQNRDENWNQLGHISKLNPDSLYMDWNIASLTKARFITIQLDSTIREVNVRQPDRELIKISMPE